MDKGGSRSYCGGMLSDAIDKTLVHRVLVIKFRHHGDVLLTSPVFRALRAAIADVEVDALIYEDSAEMLTLNPDIRTIHTINRRSRGWPLARKIASEWRLLKTLRARRYDLIVHLTEHPRGALLVKMLKPRYAVARRYPGRRGRWWRRTFTHLYDVPARQRHTVETHLDALRRLGLGIPAHTKGLRLVPGAPATTAVAERLTASGIAQRPFIVIHPTSRWLFKAWPIESMARLIRALLDAGHTVIVTGGPDAEERHMIGAILAAVGPADRLVDWSGTLSLKELAALLGQARLLVGIDSAPMHMAAALGTPVVAIFGPSGDHEWAPWQTRAAVLTAPLSCRPCGFAGCGDGQVSECLEAVTVERVLAAATGLLDETQGQPCASP